MASPATEKGIQQFVKIRIGSEWYGISIAIVENIVRMQRITRVPGSEHYIKGVINLRGKVVPVMSLRLKLDIDEVEDTRLTRIIILKIDGDELGIIVDEVREVLTLQDEDIEEVYKDSKTVNANYLVGVGKVGDDLISLLDMYEVLGIKLQYYLLNSFNSLCPPEADGAQNICRSKDLHYAKIRSQQRKRRIFRCPAGNR